MKRNKLGQFVTVTKIPRVCVVCGKTRLFYPSDIKRGRGKYCSSECASKDWAKRCLGTNNPAYSTIEIVCEFCGKVFNDIPSRNKRFCSHSCASKAKWQKINYQPVTVNHLRVDHVKAVKVARKTFSVWNCSECGTSENICVHHIDGNTKNNKSSNLKLLCKRCHASYHMKEIMK